MSKRDVKRITFELNVLKELSVTFTKDELFG